MNTILNILNGLDRWLRRGETALVILLLGTMLVLAFLQVILRNFFATGMAWADILNRYLVMWVGLLGASLATRQGRHIHIEVVSRFLSERGRAALNILLSLASAFVTAVLAKAAYSFVLDELAFAEEVISGVPTWLLQSIIPIAFGIITFQFLLNALDSAVILLNRKSS